MNAAEHLDETVWTRPASYGGHSPDGDYCIYNRNRESSILENTNYTGLLSLLEAELQNHPEADDEEPWVYDFSANHWACGWVEYIIVRKDAPQAILDMAGELYCALSEYPVLDDAAYSEAQSEAMARYWEDCSSQERMNLLIQGGMSESEADKLTDLDEIPEMTCGAWDALRDYDCFH